MMIDAMKRRRVAFQFWWFNQETKRMQSYGWMTYQEGVADRGSLAKSLKRKPKRARL